MLLGFIRTVTAAATCAALSFAHAADTVKLGLGLDLSGPFAPLGAEARDGFDLAIKLLGGKLGGVPVQAITADTAGNPDQARQVVDRMIQQDRIDVFTGPIASNVALAVGPTLFAAKIPFVSSNPGPSQYAGAQCNPYFFGLHYQNDMWDEAMGVYASQSGLQSVYLIAPNYPAGKDHIAGFKRRFKGEVVAEVYGKLGQIDFAAELAEIRSRKPAAVYFFLPGAMGINFIKQFTAAGLQRNVKLLLGAGSGESEIIQAVGRPMLGLVSATQWAPDLPNEANKRFVAEYMRAYGRYPSIFAAQAYDTVMAINGALGSLGGRADNKPALLQMLRTIKYESVRGEFTLDKNNYPLQKYHYREVVADSSGRLYSKSVGSPWAGGSDAHVAQCALK